MQRKATSASLSPSLSESSRRCTSSFMLSGLLLLTLFCVYSTNLANRVGFLSPLRRQQVDESKLEGHSIVLVAMFQDESRYLLEWIAHHKLLGISHFYLYNHLSTDDFNDTLKPLVKSGLVTLTSALSAIGQLKGVDLAAAERAQGHKLVTQLLTLHHFHVYYSARAKWSLTIDIDEFLVVEDGDSLIGRLNKIVGKDSGVGGVYIERLPFTTNGQRQGIARQQLATCTYFERIKDRELKRDRGKIVYRNEMRYESVSHLHMFHGSKGKVVDVRGGEYGGGVHKPIVIAHHLTRSLNECEEKRKVSQQYSGGWRHRVHEDYCKRMHRGSTKFRKGVVWRDEYVEKWMSGRKRRICEEMWRMNVGYCKMWKCCGMESR